MRKRKVGQLYMAELTIDIIVEMAIKKAGNKHNLCKTIKISRTTLDEIINKTHRRKAWSRTIGKLTAYVLEEQPIG